MEKKKLTSDIFELKYLSEWELSMKPGQFITFILPNIWWRAYSILKLDWKEITLIIKRWSKEMLGRGWSMRLCDAKVWEEFNWVWPAGHFVLKNTNNNKLFIGTWTGFVPLYNQILSWLSDWIKWEFKLLFWVREVKWLFYIKELDNLKKLYTNFDYKIFISREKSLHYEYWYNTDYLTKENCDNFQEYYICWAPNMIESATEKLEKIWINSEKIFFEKY